MSVPDRPIAVILLAALTIAGCEQLGFPDPAKVEAAREAEGKAIGGACRHSGRALEDCYRLNPKASKAAIYAGWRDMDAYMRENNIPTVPSEIPAVEKSKKASANAAEAGGETPPAAAGKH